MRVGHVVDERPRVAIISQPSCALRCNKIDDEDNVELYDVYKRTCDVCAPEMGINVTATLTKESIKTLK